MNIDVFSDAICPWCWIGKRKLEQALGEPGLDTITVTWRAYQLYPELPLEGMDRGEFLRLRFGSGGNLLAPETLHGSKPVHAEMLCHIEHDPARGDGRNELYS